MQRIQSSSSPWTVSPPWRITLLLPSALITSKLSGLGRDQSSSWLDGLEGISYLRMEVPVWYLVRDAICSGMLAMVNHSSSIGT